MIRINVNENDDIMQEEIFGPILPFTTINNEREAINFVNRQEKSLALYVFSLRSLARYIIESANAGSTYVNDVIFQIAPLSLPFGGVGSSGLGAYRGKYSFDIVNHHCTIVYSPNWIELLLSKRNPLYNPKAMAFVEKFTKLNRRQFRFP